MKIPRPTRPTVPVLAKGKTSTGRVWVYVRDDRPFGGADPPAAVFHYSPDRRGEHPQAHLAGWTGVLQADAFGGYGRLYGGERKYSAAILMRVRIASPETLPDADPIASLSCSLKGAVREGSDEDGQHGDAR